MWTVLRTASLLVAVRVVGAQKCGAEEDTCHAGGFTVAEAQSKLEQYWRAQTEGDAKAFRAVISDNYKYIVNGEQSTAPWTDVSFLEGFFEQVAWTGTRIRKPIGMAGPRTALALVGQEALLHSTGALIPFPAVSVTATFDVGGKIETMSVELDSVGFDILAQTLEAPVDFPSFFSNLFSAFSSGNAQGVISAFKPHFDMTRNSQEDETPWTDAAFLKLLFDRTKWHVSIISMAPASYNKATVVFKSKIDVISGPAAGNTIEMTDAWHVTMSPEKQMGAVHSVVDSLAFGELDKALR